MKKTNDVIKTIKKIIVKKTGCDGSVYVGEIYANRFPHGEGVLTSPDGSRYEGQFSYAEYHGHGTFYNPDGYIEYSGGLEYGQKHGRGLRISDFCYDTIFYDGEFVRGYEHGKGKMLLKGGRTKVGRWCGGTFKEGTITEPDGTSRTGFWSNDGKTYLGETLEPDVKLTRI